MLCISRIITSLHNLHSAPIHPLGLPPTQGQPTNQAISLPYANIFHGRYRYLGDLLQLEAAISPSVDIKWPRFHTPIQVDKLLPFLASHPDQVFASYIHRGLTSGFRIGFNHSTIQLHSRGSNHPSALGNGNVIQQRITAEVAAGRLYGPIPNSLVPLVHVSPIGLVPKAHQTNKWRLIVDLSCPRGSSVNDGISEHLCSLQYASVHHAVDFVKQLGRDTELVKLDIKDAYRIVPVHPQDYHLLAVRWGDNTYVDRALPFGLRSAPKIFTAVADFIAWVLRCQGITCQLHYLDDFLLIGAPNTKQAAHFLALALETLRMLGIPVASHKTEGPSTILTFLGILMDTHKFELRLPADKLARLQALIRSWSGKRSCTKKELESLLGHLSHAATVITQGRTFLRELFTLLSLDRRQHHYLRIHAGARADLLWWRTFLQDWNGTSFFPVAQPTTDIISDASGTYGCGAFSLMHGWFQLKWPASWESVSITAKELVPVVIAASVWGHLWKHTCVRFRSDNMAVVHLLRSHTSKDPLIMHLMRCLAFYAAFFRFQFLSEHLPGPLNTAADAISRNNIPLFMSLVPQVTQVPIPSAVEELLVSRKPDWGSRDWTKLFGRSLTRGSLGQHTQCTSQHGGDT